jgi:hypothetical protein
MNIDDFTNIMLIMNHFIDTKTLQTFVIPAQAGLNSIGLNLNSQRLARRADYMEVICNLMRRA